MEVLRVRDEKRRLRHMESLRRQKVVGEDVEESGGGGGYREELTVQQHKPIISKSQQPQKVAPCPPEDIKIHTNGHVRHVFILLCLDIRNSSLQ